MINIAIFWTWYRSDHCIGQAESHRDAPSQQNMAFNEDTPCLYCPLARRDRCGGGQKRVLLWMTLAPPITHVAQCHEGVLFRMTLAPPLNHVVQCPKTRSTLIIN